jgi:galactokinase
MAQSHASMRDDFEITLPAIDELVGLLHSAIGGEGGARMTGGGFGGAVVALMPKASVETVREAVTAGYRTPDGRAADIMVESPQNGAGLVDLS